MTTINLPSRTTPKAEERSLFVGSAPYQSNGELAFDLSGGGEIVCANVGREQALAIIAALCEAFFEPSKPVRIARPFLASIPLSEARRLSEWLDENGFEAE